AAHLGEVAGDAVHLQAGLEDQHHPDEAEGHADEDQRLVADRVELAEERALWAAPAQRAGHRAGEHAAEEGGAFEEVGDHRSSMVSRLSEIMIATAAETTASFTERPTPTAPPRVVTPK